MRRVVVTGLGMVSPIGLDVKTSWDNALKGNSGVDIIQSFDPSVVPVKIAAEVKNFVPENYMEVKLAKRSTRFVQLAMAATKEAIQDSQIHAETISERFGCSIGVGIGGIEEIYSTSLLMKEGGSRKVSPFFIPYVISNMAAGEVANNFHLKGPNICATTACTSGTHAIGEAFLYIRNDMADAMVCGGSEAAICALSVSGFANMKALSKRNDDPKTASRPFDKDRDGFVFGEGAGILILEELEAAKKRGAKIYAELLGYGMSGDAFHITSPPPQGEGAQRCMKEALRQAKIPKESVDYCNAHGTSTGLNDICETEAIIHVFGPHAQKLMVSSTKGVTGHCLGAAGGIEAVFLAKTIADQIIPPTANHFTSDPQCPLDYVPLQARETSVKIGISNSFGFGGTNGCLVLSRFDGN